MDGFFDKRLLGLRPYVPGEQPKGETNLIKLNTNESPFPPSPKAIEAGSLALNKLNLYSDPTVSSLKKAIAERLNVEADCVAVGNGSDELIAFLLIGFCENGAILNDVTYGFYKVCASLFGVETSVVPLREDFRIETDDYEGKKGTIFLANPNAPTGIALPLSEIRKLLSFDLQRLVVVDEAYVDFGAESAVKLIREYPNLIVIRTFSKSRSLAGERLGFTISSKEVASDLERVRNSFNPYNIDAVAQRMGEAAISDAEYFERTRGEIMKNRALLSEGLKKMGFLVLESKANFVFASPPDRDGGRLTKKLRERKILVRFFDENRLREFVRITVGSDGEIRALLAAVKEIYEGEIGNAEG